MPPESLFYKVADLREKRDLLKKRPQHRCFPVNFAKFLRTPFFTEHLRATIIEGELPLGDIATL